MTTDINIFFGNILAGVVASLLTSLIFWLRQLRWKYKNIFSLFGEFETFSAKSGSLIDGERIIISKDSGNVLNVRSRSSDGEWKGKMVIREDNPYLGEGYFKYTDSKTYGRHQYLISEDHNSLYVYYTDFTREGSPSGGIILRRIK
ncbi:MAG: hypothetical protein PHZ02_14145 [Desulfocapsaceae bacterium]|nr:hypothetical protein [Desulfocapsaceae bacterium]